MFTLEIIKITETSLNALKSSNIRALSVFILILMMSKARCLTTVEECFFKAVKKGNMDKIRQILVNKDFDIDVKGTNGYTALMEACYYENSDVVKLLLENKANVDVKASDGMTALAIAESTEKRNQEKKIRFNDEQRYMDRLDEIIGLLKSARGQKKNREKFIWWCLAIFVMLAAIAGAACFIWRKKSKKTKDIESSSESETYDENIEILDTAETDISESQTDETMKTDTD